MNDADKPDPIAEAIKATDQRAAAEEHQQLTVTISSTGRHVVVSFPVDISDAEMLEFTGWWTQTARLAIQDNRVKGAASRLVVARGSLPS
jgi:hypothetical protein